MEKGIKQQDGSVAATEKEGSIEKSNKMEYKKPEIIVLDHTCARGVVAPCVTGSSAGGCGVGMGASGCENGTSANWWCTTGSSGYSG